MIDLTPAAFDRFSAGLRQQESSARFAAEAGIAPKDAELYLSAIINEAHLALRLLATAGIDSRKRVLEVGAGAGLLTAFLQSRGVNLTAVEPVQDGFDATPVLARIVAETTAVRAAILPIAAHQLDAAQHGRFDVIFSINVIEHFQPLAANLSALAQVMAPGGAQIHTCPNYNIPYEPHFGMPLMPLVPAFTVRVWRRNLRDNNLWRSLNFITVSDVRRYARKNGLDATFERGQMGVALRRLRDEPAFAARHPGFLRRAADIAHYTGLLALMTHLPPSLATPMTVVLRRNDGGTAAIADGAS